ncbi:hypothetical protein [Bordetella hinzii]|uniref:hypothetical protein n=1 Tax=Bordetella hinzii TaxID=103855 RepID=UPI0011524F1F|nr:hypothetical protein [Bordetella hinzii]QDJ52630.1 hypothetical protein CBR69_21070 [Bordetella hinzii]
MKTLALLMRAYYAVLDPLIVRRRQAARLRLWGQPPAPLALSLQAEQARGRGAAQALARMRRVARRYDMQQRGRGATPMMLDLRACGDGQGLERLLRGLSSRNLSKIRRAERLGYRVRPFVLANHVHDVHAVKTSMAVRSGGPVLARWLLRPAHVGRQAARRQPWQPPACDTHWTLWWGVFIDAPGHCNGPLRTGERLVAYTKLARSGELVHYLDLMGHRDYLADGVMLLMHARIAQWLLSAATPPARGARAIWYGALEHGTEGLLTWKRRAGFVPARVRLGD